MLLREYHEEIEASLLMLPTPVDLLDFWRGKITPRRLWLLIKHLPRESPFVQAIAPGAAWGPTEHLIADLLDNYVAVHAGEKAVPIARPGQAEREASRRSQRFAQFERLAKERTSNKPNPEGGVHVG